MAFNRTQRNNKQGIEAVAKVTDPLEKKMHMIHKSQAQYLKDEAHRTGKTISILVREAIEHYRTL